MTCLTLQLSLNLATNSLGSGHRGLSKLNHVKTAWLHQCLANPLHWMKVRFETLPNVMQAVAEGENMSRERPPRDHETLKGNKDCPDWSTLCPFMAD